MAASNESSDSLEKGENGTVVDHSNSASSDDSYDSDINNAGAIQYDYAGNPIVSKGIKIGEPIPIAEFISDDNSNPLSLSDNNEDDKVTHNKTIDLNKIPDMIVTCTSCSIQINHRDSGTCFSHLALKVLVCKKCFRYYDNGIFPQDDNGLDEFCRWCAEGGKLLCCDYCNNGFCKNCIRRNFSRKEISHITSLNKWKCYVCNPKKLASLVEFCESVCNFNQSGRKSTNGTTSSRATPSTFPVVDQCLQSVSEASILFQDGLKGIKKRYNRKDKKPSKMARHCLKQLQQLLQIQIENAKGLLSMIDSVDDADLEKGKAGHKKSDSLHDASKSINSDDGPSGKDECMDVISLDGEHKTGEADHKSDSLHDASKSINCGDGPSGKDESMDVISLDGEHKTGEADHKSDSLHDASKSISSDDGPSGKDESMDAISSYGEHKTGEVDHKSDSLHDASKSINRGDDPSRKYDSMDIFSSDDQELQDTCDNPTEQSEASQDICSPTSTEAPLPKDETGIIAVSDEDRPLPDGKPPSLMGGDITKKDEDSDSQSLLQCDQLLNELISAFNQNAENSSERPIANEESNKSDELTQILPQTELSELATENGDANSMASTTSFKSGEDTDETEVSDAKITNSSEGKSKPSKLKRTRRILTAKHDADKLNSGKSCVDVKDADEVDVSDSEMPNVSETSEESEVKDEAPMEVNRSEEYDKNIEDTKAGAKSFIDTMKSDSEDEVSFKKTENANLENLPATESNMEKPEHTSIDSTDVDSSDEKTDIDKNHSEDDKNISALNALMSDSSDNASVSDEDSSDTSMLAEFNDVIYKTKSNRNEALFFKYFESHKSDEKLLMSPIVCVNRLFNNELALHAYCLPKDSSAASFDNIDKTIDNLLNISIPNPNKASAKKSRQSRNGTKPERVNLPNNDSTDADDENDESENEQKVDKREQLEAEAKTENEIAKELLADSHESASSSDEDDKPKNEQPKKAADNSMSKTNHNKDSLPGSETDREPDPPEEKAKKKNKFKICRLLKLQLWGDSSPDESKTEKPKPKIKVSPKKTKKNKIIEISSSSSDKSSSKSSSSDSDELSDYTSARRSKKQVIWDDEDDFENTGQKPTNTSKRKIITLGSSNSDSDGSIKTKKKRRRLRKVEDSENSSDDSQVEESQESPSKLRRRNIRKVFKSTELKMETKEANKAEKERRKRVLARQLLYNEVTENIDEQAVTKKLVLESDPDTKEELLAVHRDLITKLKPHQVEAVKFLWECVVESVEHSKTPGSGCILAHCMGLGKSLSLIAFIHTMLKSPLMKFKTCLVVCPLNTVLNWSNELQKWLDSEELRLNVFEFSAEKRNHHRSIVLQDWIRRGGVAILGYEMYRNLLQKKPSYSKHQKDVFHKALLDPGPDIVVCDEGHVLRNSSTGISKAINGIRTLRRIILTGTPIQNNLKEYHCMVGFVKPLLLGTYKEFTNRFLNPITNGQCADSNSKDVKLMKKRIHVLFNLLNGCVQTRDYSDLTKHLTPKYEYVISIRLSDTQLKMYQYYLDNRVEIRQKKGAKIGTGSTLLPDYHIFQMISNHPWLLQLSQDRAKGETESEPDSINNFICDDTTEPSSSSSGNESADSDVVLVKDGSESPMPNGPNNSKDDGLKNKDEARQDNSDWWDQFLDYENELNLEISGKIMLLFTILSECEIIGDKILLFSQSLLSLDLIENCLQKMHQQSLDKVASDEYDPEQSHSLLYNSWLHGTDYFRMDGSTKATIRRKFTRQFNNMDNPRARLFLISTKAGSLGINLVAANRVIIFDASWNPSHDLQAIFRAYRFGQTKPVYIYRFLAQGTMEEKVYDRQIMKQSMSFRVTEEKQMDRHFTAADLADLYSFNPESKSKHATPMVPKDRLLAELLISLKDFIVSYHEHDSLLQSMMEEDLTEEERKVAWVEYEAEKKGLWDAVSGTLGPGQSYFDINTVIQAILKKNPDASQDELISKTEKVMLIVKQKQLEANRQQAAAILQQRQRMLSQVNDIRNQNQAGASGFQQVPNYPGIRFPAQVRGFIPLNSNFPSRLQQALTPRIVRPALMYYNQPRSGVVQNYTSAAPTNVQNTSNIQTTASSQNTATPPASRANQS